MKLPKNETVRLIKGISGVSHTPEVIEGETSSTGKTIAVEVDNGGGSTKTYRLDTEKILSEGLEVRRATTFELYTPERFQRKQKSNYAPGPQVGVNEVSEANDLPEPTHEPVTS